MSNKISIFTIAVIGSVVCGNAFASSCALQGIPEGAQCGSSSQNYTFLPSSCYTSTESEQHFCVTRTCGSDCNCIDSRVGCPFSGCLPCETGSDTWEYSSTHHSSKKIGNYIQDFFTCECQAIYSYKCEAGYYPTDTLSSFDKFMICNKCPGLVDKDGLTRPGLSNSTVFTGSTGGTIGRKDCYMPTTYTFKDSVGEYRFSNTCYFDQP